MANNKLKAYVRYDGTGRIIPGSLILNRFKPKVGNWQEIDANECCNYAPVNTFNFDITANWSLTTPAVVDEASFKTFLESGQDGNGNSNNQTGVVITDFLLEGNRLRCNVTANGGYLGLSSLEVTNVNAIGNIVGISQLDLDNNQIVTFDPLIALPNGLEELYLNDNQIVIFNPSLPLPNSIINLGLHYNQIVTFDPTLPLPSSLIVLSLYYNQIVNFNPSLPLPDSLSALELNGNQMTTAGYTASEPWANAMSVIPARGNIYFDTNVNSASGTNLETILTAKGWSVVV